jgi:putative ABC transport system substrate-binding protein
VTVLGNPLHPGSDIERASSEAAGGRLGISIDFIATPNQEVLATARATLARTRPDAISLLPDGFALAHRKPIMAIADELRIPSFRDGRLCPSRRALHLWAALANDLSPGRLLRRA